MTTHAPAQPVVPALPKATATGCKPGHQPRSLVMHPVPDDLAEPVAPDDPHGMNLNLRCNPGSHRTKEGASTPSLLAEVKAGDHRGLPAGESTAPL